jgi:hypothetical protein
VELEKTISTKHRSFRDCLAPKVGKVYVVSITRDGCPVCVKQKPKIDKLAKTKLKTHNDRVIFSQIHVRYSVKRKEESLRSKDLLGHYFYPTNLILIRSRDKGTFEYYRAASPRISELARNIDHAVEVAKMLEKQ